VYDTEKATPLADDKYGLPGDLKHWYEALYKTAKGNYFLYGEGGPMTRYGRNVGNNTTSGGSAITPLSREEAFRWCQDHGVEAVVIEREFADMVEEA